MFLNLSIKIYNILRLVIVKPGISLYRRAVIPGFCPIHFTTIFAGQTNVDRYTRNIVIPKIVKPEFHCNSRNLCVDYESENFRYKCDYVRLNTDNFTMDPTIL